MRGLSNEEIKAHREIAIEKIKEIFHGDVEIVDSFFEGESTPDNPLEMLGKSISMLNDVDAIYMCEGWHTARGCTLEHECAMRYGKEVYYETSSGNKSSEFPEINDLSSTIPAMLSSNYKDRFFAEYWQTKMRYERLHNMIVAYTAGTLEFKPTCPMELLNEQAANMGRYLFNLEVRAQVEGIKLGI